MWCAASNVFFWLEQVERFFKETMKIPRYAPRLDCMIFKYGFDRDAADLKEVLDIVNNACKQVTGGGLSHQNKHDFTF